VVLAVSPNDTQVLINDQVRQLFYIYSVSGGSATTIGGMGNAAAWTRIPRRFTSPTTHR